MGNRAAIRTTQSNCGIYLHWNGGVESVLAFLEAAKQLDVRDPEYDDAYCLARLTQIIGNFFGGTLSLGIMADVRGSDYADNGIFVIGKGFKIVERIDAPDNVTEVDQLDPEQRKYYDGVLAEALNKNQLIFGE